MAPPRPSRIPRILLYVFLIAAAGIAAYWNGLRAPFIWDDDPAIISNTTIRSVLPLSASLSPPLETAVAGRPIVNLSFAVTYAMAGLDETAYHSGNLAILIASALLLFAIVRQTVIRLGHPAERRRDRPGVGVGVGRPSSAQRNGGLHDAAYRIDDGPVSAADDVRGDPRA